MRQNAVNRGLLVCAGLLNLVASVLYFESNYDRLFSVSADESRAVQTLRNISIQQTKFRSQHGCFADHIDQFSNINPQAHGYTYFVQAGTRADCITNYLATASPNSEMRRRNALFFSIDENGTIRSEWKRTPDAAGRIIE